MDVAFLIARVLIALLFLISALGHLTQASAMTGYAQSRGLPAAGPAVVLSGLLLLASSLMVLLGVWGDLGSLLLLVFLVPTAFLMHAFWRESDPMAKQLEMVQFHKDLALAGTALALFVVFRSDIALTVTGPLFS